jgi:hypothetical protein
VAFYFKKLSQAKLNYDVHNEKLVAIISCFEEWNHILCSPKDVITVFTNYQNLIYFNMKKVLKPWQICWTTKLAKYNFKVVYRPGKLNTKADVLSYHWNHALEEGGKAPILSELRLFKPGQLQMETQELKLSIACAHSVCVCKLKSALLDEIHTTAKVDNVWQQIKQVVESK